MCSLLFGSARAKNVQATQRTISSLLLVAVALCGAGSCAVAAQPQHQPELNCVAPTAIAHRARRLCGGMRARDALLAAGLSATVAEEAGSVLLGLGFETALDLRLLVGKELREEFAAELKASRLSISDRAKIQLLVGDGAEPHSVQQGGARSSATVDRSTQWSEQIEGRDDGCSFRRRQQSEGRDDGSSFRRRQQSDVDDGLSTDTLAIVLSVLVGAAGYVVQAYTARRAERSANAQAQELHISEQTRQREHEQMLAQINRINRWLDDGCRPLQLLGWMARGRYSFVQAAVRMLESVAPEAVQTMVEQSKALHYAVSADGKQALRPNGTVMWDAAAQPNGLTHAYSGSTEASISAASLAVSTADTFTFMSKPLSKLLPETILDFVAADPTTPLARQFRLYVQNSWVFGMRRLSKLLEAHSAVMELPPTEWLKEKYPQEIWEFVGSGFYHYLLLAHTQAWESVLAQWESNEHGVVHPALDGCFPFRGIFVVNEWSITRAQTRQKELIGMTVEAELRGETFYERITSKENKA